MKIVGTQVSHMADYVSKDGHNHPPTTCSFAMWSCHHAVERDSLLFFTQIWDGAQVLAKSQQQKWCE
jgi:hypothetical protein